MKSITFSFTRLLLCIVSIAATALTSAAQVAPDSVVSVGAPSLPQFMKLYKNGDLLLKGNYDGGMFPNTPAHYPPMEGPGNRLMWMPERGAFRLGGVDGSQWDGSNTGYYSLAMGWNSRASGDHSIAIGRYCFAANTGAFAAGDSNYATGRYSVALGHRAHTNARRGSFVFADDSDTTEVRSALPNNAMWRVAGGFRVFTSYSFYDASVPLQGVVIQSPTAFSPFDLNSGEIISTHTGAYLSSGGVWQNASDVNKKHLFENISGEDLLNRLRLLPIREWSYKAEANNIRHLGPTAQDFKAAFGLGKDDVSIGTVDADGVALAGVQALDSRTLAQANEITQLKTQNDMLQARLTALEKEKSGFGNKAAVPVALTLLLAAGVWGMLARRRRSAS